MEFSPSDFHVGDHCHPDAWEDVESSWLMITDGSAYRSYVNTLIAKFNMNEEQAEYFLQIFYYSGWLVRDATDELLHEKRNAVD